MDKTNERKITKIQSYQKKQKLQNQTMSNIEKGECKTEPNSRPTTVKFNVEYDYNQQKARPTTSVTKRSGIVSTPQSSKTLKKNKTKTADVSHITDQRKGFSVIPSFIPDEFKREVTTPTPLKPGTGSLNVQENTWHTQVFPTESGASRDEVSMLADWLNEVLQKNIDEHRYDSFALGTNANHWYDITYEELCRQINSECPERAQLLLAIWKRYQLLFQRVSRLHEEEKKYLIDCHKKRTTELKQELDKTQSRLKIITQQYRDDQERWSNAREREETKFSNMRKKLDLQVKNKRTLMLKLKTLQERLESEPTIGMNQPNNDYEIILGEEEPNQEMKKEKLTPSQVSDRVHALRQRIRNDYSYMTQIISPLDDIAHFLDKDIDSEESFSIRNTFPQFFKSLPITHSGHVRSLQWFTSVLTYFYGFRLTDLCERRYPFPYPTNRLHFANSIYAIFLRTFGTPYQASEVLFDLFLTAKTLAEKQDNLRAKMFLRFIDFSNEYYDSIYLDFYCYCVGSCMSSIPEATTMFPDAFNEEVQEMAQIKHLTAIDISKKIFFAISDGDLADTYAQDLIEKYELQPTDPDRRISYDLILEYMVDIYKKEEERVEEQLFEHYEMDAAQYDGIVTLAQFQTLSMFSPRKIDYRAYTEMMRNTFIHSSRNTITFKELIEELHRYNLLVPFVFDRIDYVLDNHPSDSLTFMKNELLFHDNEYEMKLEKLQKTDEAQYQSLKGLRTKFEQVIDTNRTGLFTEIAQREFYEKFSSLHIEP